jgi:Flp pilus assembly protein TadG
MTSSRNGCRGQAATETMMVMMFLLLLVFGFIHFCMLAATKYVVNYAASAAARSYMMLMDEGAAKEAAQEAISTIAWWRNPADAWRNDRVDVDVNATFGTNPSRGGVKVTFRVPFGFPLFTRTGSEGQPVVGFATYTLQPDIPETGDNAEK